MKPWHAEMGLTPRAAAMAEHALPMALDLVGMCGNDPVLAAQVLKEAVFRRCELPERTKEYRDAYLKRNG